MAVIEKKRIVRFIKFGVIGATGIVVNTSVLWILHEWLGLAVFLASPLAIGLAIFNNFTWNDRFTWKENRDRRKYTYWHRLWKYYLSASLGGAINYVSLLVLTEFFSFNYLIANLSGILLGMVSNFSLSEWWVFRSRTD
ncbi:MAG TPA: GtrA family protein [Caldithrix abyssi]|uniref:GtrA family protein n=1 Tax=Caldithrix abyssi TaxID=187145 RepID=A0A7V5UF32_CALAY|nr:GtrA family protein [Caldithrix abyssi]